jgi:hypothetical protein
MPNPPPPPPLAPLPSFQPTVITRRSADPPTIPEGATVFYTARIAAGEGGGAWGGARSTHPMGAPLTCA